MPLSKSSLINTMRNWRTLIKKLSVKQLLLLSFLLTALLPMLIVTWLSFYQARATLREEITRDMQTRATAAFAEVDNMMFERLQNVVSWSHLEVMHEVVIADVDKRLSNFLNELKTSYRGVYQNLYVVNTQGVVVASSSAAQIGKTFNHTDAKPWQQIQFSGSNVHVYKVSSIADQSLPIAIDIWDADQHKIGTLWAMFNWSAIQTILKHTQNKGSAAALLDENGHIIANTPDWQKVLAAYEISVRSNLAGLQTKPIFNWQIAISQRRAVAMAPVARMGYTFIFLLAITALFATLLANPLSRNITAPLARLTDYANRFMRSSQVSLPVVEGPTEVRAMSDAFAKMVDDLTLSKENLTRAAKLAVAGEMAAAMSHEVRTPLGILRSSAQVLAREKNLSVEAAEVVGFINTETERLNKLVSTLVDSARPRQPEFAMHDMVTLLEHAVAMLRMQANKKSISLNLFNENTVTNHAKAPVLVACDDEQITQVLLNLLLNAIQVLPSGGKVLVSLHEEKDKVTISVADNGFGVNDEQKLHIFDPFFTQRPGGIGLGLAVSRQIVVAHFGTLTVENSTLIQTGNDGKNDAKFGADFRMTLPKQQLG